MSKFTTYKNGGFRLSRDNLRQLDPKVFERAAEEVDKSSENAFTCFAIRRAANETFNGTHLKAWSAAFEGSDAKDTSDKKHPFWNYGLYNSDPRSARSVKQARMTSLALMATLVRDAKASRGKKIKQRSLSAIL